MFLFLALMVAGLTGLVMLALPGLMHGHVGGHHIGPVGHSAGHIGHPVAGHHVGGQAAGHAAHGSATHGNAPSEGDNVAAGAAGKGWLGGLIPSPRTIFSLMALYGAFGNALVKAGNLTPWLSSLLAVIPALLIERFLVTPLWNTLFQSQAEPCSALEELVLSEAEAVTPFRNGRGVVSVVRDGRLVQFTAHLPESQAAIPVRVGDKLYIEEVDAANERLTVTLHQGGHS